MASSTVGEVAIEFKADTGKAEKTIRSFGEVARESIINNIVTKGFNVAVNAAKDFASSVVKVGMTFEKSMSNVAAISGATGSDLEALTAKAQEMGEKTVWSASDAADAMGYMAMAGWKTEDMLDGIAGMMDLATAAGADLATTSDIVTDALTAFGLSAKDSGRLADVMAAASSNANTNVELMGETFKYAASVAGAMGYSIEDTAVAIGLMANAGIKGSQAGTSLRSIMSRLATDTSDARTELEKLGVQVIKEDGSMRDLGSVMVDMRKKLSKLSQEEQINYAKTIAGQEAMSGLLAIINASDDDFNKLTKAVANSNGAAAEMAAIMGDNLAGNMASLNSKFEALQIELYNQVAPAINVVVDGLKWAIDNMEIIAPILGGLTAALIAFKVATIAQTIAQNGLNLTFLASPLTWIAIAIGAVVAGLLLLWNNCEGFRNFVMGFFEVIRGIWEWIIGAVSAIWETVKTVFGAIANFVGAVVDGIVGYFQWWWDIVNPILQAIWNVFKAVFDFIWGIVSTVIGNIVTAFQNLWTIVSFVIGKVKDAFKGAWDFITGIFGKVGSWFKDRFTEAFNAIKSIFSGIGSFFQGIWNNITGIFTKIGTTIGDAVGGAFKSVVNAILTFAENFVNAPIRAINTLIDVINKVPGINLGYLNELQLPRMETGGIVPGSSYSGDHNLIRANSGEMVITRSQQAALWEMIEHGNYGYDEESENSTIDNSSIEINNNYQINSTLDAEEVGDMVLESIRRAVI